MFVSKPSLPLHQGKEDTNTFPTNQGLAQSSISIILHKPFPNPPKSQELGPSPDAVSSNPYQNLSLSPIMPRLTSRHGTSPFIWCAAIICAVISIAVIFGGIAVFAGYMIIHPRVPILSVADAHLDFLKYDIVGVLQTQITIVIRAENDNTKVRAWFDNMKLTLSYQGKAIAYLKAAEFEVEKERSLFFHYLVQSYPIPLNPSLMQTIDFAIKQDDLRFELEGGAKTRWRVGPLGSVKFWCNLGCQLRFRPSDHSYVPSTCTSSGHKH